MGVASSEDSSSRLRTPRITPPQLPGPRGRRPRKRRSWAAQKPGPGVPAAAASRTAAPPKRPGREPARAGGGREGGFRARTRAADQSLSGKLRDGDALANQPPPKVTGTQHAPSSAAPAPTQAAPRGVSRARSKGLCVTRPRAPEPTRPPRCPPQLALPGRRRATLRTHRVPSPRTAARAAQSPAPLAASTQRATPERRGRCRCRLNTHPRGARPSRQAPLPARLRK